MKPRQSPVWREAYRKADTRAETTIRVIINIIWAPFQLVTASVLSVRKVIAVLMPCQQRTVLQN